MATIEEELGLAQWLNQVQAEVAADRAEQERLWVEREGKRQAEIQAAWERFDDQVAALLPEELRPFMVRGDREEDSGPHAFETVGIDLLQRKEPDPFLRVHVFADDQGQVRLANAKNNGWRDEPWPYEVTNVEEKLYHDGEGYHIALWSSGSYAQHFMGIRPAVVTALEMYARYDVLVKERERKNAEGASQLQPTAAEKTWEEERLGSIRAAFAVFEDEGRYEDASIRMLGVIATALVKIAAELPES